MAINPSASTLRPPRAPYGGRLFGTEGMQGANTQEYGNENMAGAIGDNLMGLLGGKNAAADQADRTNLTALTQLQKGQAAGTQRNAAQMGIQPGDPRYAAYQAKNNADQYSMGSKILGDAQQGRLNDQSRTLTTAIGFNQGQQNYGMDQQKLGEDTRRFDQNFGESARRYDQDFTSSEKGKEVQTLFDIINNPLSSEGQVEAAKQRLLQTQSGLDAGTYNTPEKSNAQHQFDEIKSQLSVMNPGMSDQELDAMARERFAQVDKASYDTLLKANGAEVDGGGDKDSGQDRSIMQRTRDLGVGGGKLGAAPMIGIGSGIGHAGAETYRGARDIGRGDVLGGTGRIFAAPARGVGHGVMDAGRTAKSNFKRVMHGLFG